MIHRRSSSPKGTIQSGEKKNNRSFPHICVFANNRPGIWSSVFGEDITVTGHPVVPVSGRRITLGSKPIHWDSICSWGFCMLYDMCSMRIVVLTLRTSCNPTRTQTINIINEPLGRNQKVELKRHILEFIGLHFWL